MRGKGGEGGICAEEVTKEGDHSTGNFVMEGSFGFAQELSSVVGKD
jgi:hypothetical protein